MTDFESTQQLFEHVVNKSYLALLSDNKYCEAIAFQPHSDTLAEDKERIEQQVEMRDLRWVKISKLVLEKGVFTPDHLSMVYSALHPMADTIAILLKKERGVFSLYLGVRDNDENGNFVSFNALKNALNGFFPGVVFDSEIDEKKLSIYPLPNERTVDKEEEKPIISYSVSAVSGVGALKDDRKQFYIQGLEKLIEGSRAIKDFSILFLAERIDSEDARRVIDSYSQISSSLVPLSQRQISLNQTKSESVTDTLTKSFSSSVTRNLGTTTSCGSNHSKFKSSIDSIGVNMGGSVGVGDSASANLGIGYGHSWVKGESDGFTDQWGYSESVANTTLEQDAQSNAKMKSWAEGITHQFTIQERTIKLYVDLLDKQIKRLSSSIPYGLWNMASYCIVNDSEERSKSLAAIFKGAIVGDNSDVDTVRINYWNNSKEVQSCLEECVHPRFKLLNNANGNVDVIVTPASVVSSKELAIMMPFPQHSVPGIIVREQASFGRNVEFNEDPHSLDGTLKLGSISFLGQEEQCEVGLNIPLLTSHTFVTGTTGSGKTNTVFLFLSRLPDDVNFMVIEPAKGEYKDVLSGYAHYRVKESAANPDLKLNPFAFNVFGTNPDYCELLKFNPFSFCKGIHVFEHIESIVQIFNACWPMYAAMPVVLKRSIEEAYRLCGWDLAKSTNANEPALFPTISDVVSCMNRILDDSKYSSDTKSDYRGALETRLLALSEGLLGEMFTGQGPDFVDEERLFEQKTIVDLSRLDNPETKALLMGLLVHKLKEWRMCHGAHQDLKHITVLEEAHHLLRKTSITQNQEGANIAGKAVEMLVNGIAEMRSFGEGFVIVDQTPSLLDPSVIRNTNTKILLNLPDYEDRLVVGKAIGLNDDQIIELGKQKRGYAIINQSNWEEPVQCRIDEFLYEKSSRYRVADSIVPKSDTIESTISQEVLGFLLNKRLRDRPSFDIDRMRDSIMSSDISSVKKYQLISLFEKYSELPESQKDEFFLWRSENFDLLAKTVSEYVGLEKEFEDAIRRDCTPIAFDLSINRLVENRIPGVLPSMRLNLQHCVLRSIKKNKDELNRFKAWYLRNRK